MTFFHRTRPSLLHPPFFHTRGFSFFFLFHNPLISSFFFSFLLYICLGGILPSRFLKTFEPEFEAIRGHLAHPPKVHSYSAAAAVSVLSTVLSVFSTSRWMGLLLKTSSSSSRLFVKIIGSYPSASSHSRREGKREGGESKYSEQSIMQK